MMLRPLRESDRDYVTRSILMLFLSGSRYAQKINKDAYMRAQNDIVNGLLDNAKTVIMSDPDQDDLIYGFVIYDNLPSSDVLHYFYMRKDFRNKGLASELIKLIKKHPQLAFSHLTDNFKPARLKGLWDKILFDPSLAHRR